MSKHFSTQPYEAIHQELWDKMKYLENRNYELEKKNAKLLRDLRLAKKQRKKKNKRRKQLESHQNGKW